MDKEKIKILCLSNRGMLGHIVGRYFTEQGYETYGLNRQDLDFRDFSHLGGRLMEFQAQNPNKKMIVINCAGILITGKDIQEFADINITLPRFLKHLADRDGFKLISIGSNCVYSDSGPHNEDERITGKNVLKNLYGMSKAFGEINDKTNLQIRCSILGPELKKNGSGMFDWFVNKSGQEVNGYTNGYFNGITTLELSKFIEKAIKEDYTGLINYYTKVTMSKFEICNLINKIWNLGKKVIPVKKDGVHVSLLAGPHYTTKTFETQFKELKEEY